MTQQARNIAPLPWRVCSGALRRGFPDVVSVYDATGNEILHWSGFDSSTLSKTKRKALAKFIVESANAAFAGTDRKEKESNG